MTHPARFDDNPAYAHRYLIALGVILGAVMELIDTSIVNVALSDMSANLGVTIDEITWVVVGYILSAVIVLPMTGWLAAYFGRRRYFLASVTIFTVSSFFCGTAGSLGALVFWRLMQGVGGGALIATAQAILFDAFPPHQKTVAAAIFGLGMIVGPAIGPTLGGIIGILATVRFVHEPEDIRTANRAQAELMRRNLDWQGIVCMSVGLAA
ncbi:MAG: MFS transporter, partial [Gemmatimonadota bacterium]|nr:MFS transporter [Gemmatimonadota bacterium]